MKLRALRRLALATAAASLGLTGVAQAGTCRSAPLSQLFKPWGDSAYYTLVPGVYRTNDGGTKVSLAGHVDGGDWLIDDIDADPRLQ